MTDTFVLQNPYIESIAGFVAGITSTLVSHPLDVIKTRLQVDRFSSSHLGSSLHVARIIIRSEENKLAAVYRGLSPNLVGNSVSWALYFVWYDKVKKHLQLYHGENSKLSYYDFFLASGVAGTLTAIITNPIWVIKTRMLSTSSRQLGAYSSITDGFKQIFRSEGLRGFYHGLVPSLFGVSHGALQFMAYEKLKIYRNGATVSEHRDLSTFDLLIISGLAKIFAGSITYPYQLIRARLQMYDAERLYSGMRDAMGQIWKQEGFGGFYKGMGPNLLRVMPSTCVTFLVYEKSRSHLPSLLAQIQKS